MYPGWCLIGSINQLNELDYYCLRKRQEAKKSSQMRWDLGFENQVGRQKGKRMNDDRGEQCEWKLHAMFHTLQIVWIASA